MVKVKRSQQRRPLLAKIESGGLGGSWKPASRADYSDAQQAYKNLNDGLGKAMKYGLGFFEGMMDEVFDVKIGSHRKATRGRAASKGRLTKIQKKAKARW